MNDKGGRQYQEYEAGKGKNYGFTHSLPIVIAPNPLASRASPLAHSDF
jgi:hypothetical protein